MWIVFASNHSIDLLIAREFTAVGDCNWNVPTGVTSLDYVVVAEFQADSYMLGQLLNNDVIMAMTKDTDIPILAGDCGMVLNEFTKNKYQIVGTSEFASGQGERG